jgi:hypothetical protein
VADVTKRVWISKANITKPYAKLKIGRVRWPLYRFSAYQIKGQGVRATVMGQAVHEPRAFIAKGPKAGYQVFERVIQPWQSTRGWGRDIWEMQKSKLRKVPGASPAQAFNALPGETQKLQAMIREDLNRQIASQVQRALAGK